jgi:hypothetical protein
MVVRWRAQILLAADADVSGDDIATTVGVGGSTVYRTNRRFVEGNLERALSEEPLPGAERKLTGKEVAALLVATACSRPPLKSWFENLHSGKGPCCSDADGTALSDVDWKAQDGMRSGGGQAAMADVAYPLSDEEITALAHYLAHL